MSLTAFKSMARLLRPRRDSLLEALAPYTLIEPAGLACLKRLCREITQAGVAGDIVECGTYKGGSAAVLSTELGSRHLWLYDSFQGMPACSGSDGESAAAFVGQCKASPRDVREALRIAGTPEQKYTIREGLFRDTLALAGPERVALLHCDADWYDSVTEVLERFYPLVPAGGCVVLDDFGYWEGCREAFYAFCHRHGERPRLERSGNGSAALSIGTMRQTRGTSWRRSSHWHGGGRGPSSSSVAATGAFLKAARGTGSEASASR